MTPGQYRLHRQSVMRAAMRASGLFARLADESSSGLACGPALSSVAWVHAPGVAAHPGTNRSGLSNP